MTQTIDITVLNDVIDDDAILAERVLLLFESTLNRCTETLQKNLSHPESWQRLCHELKGAAGSVGAKTLAQHCAQAEQSAPSISGIEQMQTLGQEALQQLRAHYHI